MEDVVGRRCNFCTARVAALAIALAAVALALPAAAHAAKFAKPKIEVLSTRADLVSGGEALVVVQLPRHVRPAMVRMLLGKRNVTSEFRMRPNGRYEGLLKGLKLGRNTVTAHIRHRSQSRITIFDHPIGGPVLAGPQLKPWVCKNGSKNPKCNAPTTYSYQYKSSTSGGLEPYDPKRPPSDVATTTTQTGAKVPFIIRTETGYQDRDQYQVSVLYQPGKPWKPWAPQRQFNHKLLITHGASCGIDHQSSTAPSTTSDTVGVPGGPGASSSPTTALGMGFAVMSTALDNAGHNCNLVTEAESLIIAKEHLIDRYGTLRYTIGTGCSGGSLVQQQVANAYPGIYQGILPQCSFPDAWSTGQQLAAYHFGRLYFENPTRWGTGVVWTPTQIAAVDGHPNYGNVVIFDSVYWNALANPSNDCAGVPANDVYNEQTNPRGVRCTLADDMINVFGRRPRSAWGAGEKKVGHGFAGLPISDVGVQFGLNALMDGQISPAQFVDLNVKVGGADIDLNPTPQRTDATEPALRNDYRSGAVNETNNLKNVAIIDLRGPDPGAFHDAYRSWTIRQRLQNVEGQFPKNDVIWFGETPLIGDPNYTVEGLEAMDRWLSAVDSDHHRRPLQQKIAQDRPADVHDRCSDANGLEKVSLPGVGPVCNMPLAQTKFATPYMEAGESIATDDERCQLKPLRRSDYGLITFTDAQWSQLEQTFPHGVCDWSRPGVDQSPTIPWLTYQNRRGRVIYGGKRLGAAPGGSGAGWADPAFNWWTRG
jgi:hypothetical protein